ncbi:MAG: glycosyltransferase [Candidatus Omnitrophica bacterium]|nr:glycosyltransferase [Candidatus Omnitrophota bacterium]
MKIALVGPSYPYKGGISHYTTLLYRELIKKHRVVFFSFRRQYPKWLYPAQTDLDESKTKIKEENIKFTLDSLNPFSWIKTALLIKRSSVKLLILPWWHIFWTPQFAAICWIVKLSCKTKVLFICHNTQMHESRFLDRACARIALSNGDYFIVHSQKEKENLLKLIPGADIKTAFHPIYDVFRQGGLSKDGAKDKLGIKGRVILFFGIVREYKGLKYLLEAMPRVLKELEDITLIVAGEFWKNKSYYIDLINKLNIGKRVKVIDRYIPNEEVEKYFEAADLAVFPYISVTGSGAVALALAFDKPVVTTDIGPMPDLVLDGKTGYIAKPEDSNSLAQAILSFFQQDHTDFVENIKKRKGFFAWDKVVKAIESFMLTADSNLPKR